MSRSPLTGKDLSREDLTDIDKDRLTLPPETPDHTILFSDFLTIALPKLYIVSLYMSGRTAEIHGTLITDLLLLAGFAALAAPSYYVFRAGETFSPGLYNLLKFLIFLFAIPMFIGMSALSILLPSPGLAETAGYTAIFGSFRQLVFIVVGCCILGELLLLTQR